MIFNFFL